MEIFLLDNSNNIWLRRVRNELQELVSDAVFEATVTGPAVDEEGAPIISPVLLKSGADPGWPLPFSPRGLGDYSVHLPAELDIKLGVEYTIEVSGTADGRFFLETRKMEGRRRGH